MESERETGVGLKRALRKSREADAGFGHGIGMVMLWLPLCWKGPFDLGRPGRIEACAITQWSLIISVLFWLLSFFTFFDGETTNGDIVSVGLESFLDVLSTCDAGLTL